MTNKLSWTNNELEDLVWQLGIALEASGIGIWQHNLRKNQTLWDEHLQAIYGVAKEPLEVVWLDSVHPDDCQNASAIFEKAILERSDYASEFRIIRPDGTVRHLRSRAKYFVDGNGDPCFVGAEFDVTEDVLRNQQLAFEREAAEQSRIEARYAADHDYLTGLFNRRAFDENLQSMADPHGNQPVGLCHIDIDHFKEVNDRFGHAGGDAVLRHMGAVLRETINADEFAVRLGGDEFAVVSRSTDPNRIVDIASAIRAALRDPLTIAGRTLPIQCSIGVAVAPINELDALLQSSDTALYVAKKNGRNRIETFSISMAAEIIAKKHDSLELKEAIAAHRIIPYYQIQVDARDHSIIGMEALARWEHADGLRFPDQFLPLAAEHDLIREIDDEILRHVLADIEHWSALGCRIPRVSVNMSAARLADPDLQSKLAALSIRPGQLSFELVETIFLDSPGEQIERNLNLIRERGIDIEIDDLGSGHASLIGLIKLRPDRVKIDKQLIFPVTEGAAPRSLISALVDIAKALGIEVIAEGVETLNHAALLAELGVDVLQGYAFGRPSARDSITDKFRSVTMSISR